MAFVSTFRNGSFTSSSFVNLLYRSLHISSTNNGLFSGFKRDTAGIAAQSNRLSDGGSVFEVQIHLVRPHYMGNYLQETEKFIELFREKQSGAELVGSFTCEIGYQDDAIHIWRFKGGYESYQKHYHLYRTDPELLHYRMRRNEMLRSRKNQICLPFSFWPAMEPSTIEQHIYEMRTYNLKPGQLLEWGNYWAQGLKHRRHHDEIVSGLFSHIGEMHQVHHLWRYKDLVHRNEVRDWAWTCPGWDDTVRATVPLIDNMSCRILKPTPFSPLQ